MARKLFRRNYLKHRTSPKLDNETRKYLPLYGTWLLDMSLQLNWYQPPTPRRWPEIFNDADFCAMTGMTPIDECDEDDDEDEPNWITGAQCRKMLIKRREQLQLIKLSPHLTLFKNIDLLTELLDLTESDQAVLTFAAGLSIFPGFNDAISSRAEKVTTQSFCRLLASLTDIKEKELIRSFAQDSPLVTTGLVKVERHVCDLEQKVSVMAGLEDVLQAPHKTVDDLVARFMRRAAPPTLTLDNFPHMHKDREILRNYLSNALAEKAIGVNVLFHGKPGVGKNEFVQALAKEMNVDLYEVSYTDQDGDPIKGEARLQAYALCQRLLARNQNAMLLFDEIEDIFGSCGNIFAMLFGVDDVDESGDSYRNGKAWINRTLENNPVPAVWLSNRVKQIDKAYLRRFDYSIRFPLPPQSVRLTIAKHHLDCFDPPESLLERIAANEEITPGQLESAAKVARIASKGDKPWAIELINQTLERSSMLLDQKLAPIRNIVRTSYDLSLLNTDVDIHNIVSGLKRRSRGSFCFYGVAGTGKSELARHIADQVGKPLLMRRASDILDKYVGESEKKIAAMFAEARQQDAVLVLDEADSFLTDRRDAVRSWEVTQVNELLTQMEAHEGIFICTTNLMEKLDQASLRRFGFKVKFDSLTSDQRWTMFRNELGRLGGIESDVNLFEKKVRNLDRLTPGDFAVAARQYELWDIVATPDKLYELLHKECEVKGASLRKIGFGAM